MSQPTKPGQLCLVVGGRSAFNGEGKGPNQGRKVVTMFLHDEKAGLEQENVWHCRTADKEPLHTYYGVGPEADFLECWLEVCPPDAEPPAQLTKEQELSS